MAGLSLGAHSVPKGVMGRMEARLGAGADSTWRDGKTPALATWGRGSGQVLIRLGGTASSLRGTRPHADLTLFPGVLFPSSPSFSTNILCADFGSHQKDRAAPPKLGLVCSCWFSFHVAPMLPSSRSHAHTCSCPFLPACCVSLLAFCTHVSLLLLGCQELVACWAFHARISLLSALPPSVSASTFRVFQFCTIGTETSGPGFTP
jgi:hypothetical protein